MSFYGSCHNSDEHQREGRGDFERYGRPDPWMYNDQLNDCNRAYTDGYDEAKREDDRREEYRQEERREEERQERQAYDRRRSIEDFESALVDSYYQQEQDRQYDEMVSEQEAQMQKEFPELVDYGQDDLPF